MRVHVLLLAVIALFAISSPSVILAQGGGEHQYPDLYTGDVYLQNNPNAHGQAFIDRSDLTDYPSIVFNNYGDFLFSITHEQASWETFFPLGVNLVYTEFDGVDEILFEKFVFEPSSSQLLFETPESRDLFLLANPGLTPYFGLFEEANKPVKSTVGHIYVIWIDTNGNDQRDPGEDTYVGSSAKIEDRFLIHDQNGMLAHPKGKIKVYEVKYDGVIIANDEGKIDDDDDPNTGGGEGPGDTGGGDYLAGGNGGGVTVTGITVREILEYYEQLFLEEVIKDNQSDNDKRDPGDVPVREIPEVKNKKHVMSETRMTDTFGDDPPAGTTDPTEVSFTYKKVPSFQGQLGGDR